MRSRPLRSVENTRYAPWEQTHQNGFFPDMPKAAFASFWANEMLQGSPQPWQANPTKKMTMVIPLPGKLKRLYSCLVSLQMKSQVFGRRRVSHSSKARHGSCLIHEPSRLPHQHSRRCRLLHSTTCNADPLQAWPTRSHLLLGVPIGY